LDSWQADRRRGPHSAPASPAGASWGALAEGIADGVLVVDADGVVAAHNRCFLDLWELETEMVAGRAVIEVMGLLAGRLVDPNGPDGQGCSGMASFSCTEHGHLFRLKDGRIIEGCLASRKTAAPAVTVWSFRDVTERERAIQRTALLAEAGRLLISLDLDATLEAVARSALPLLGELCAVDRITGDKVDRRLEVRMDGAPWLEPPEVLMAAPQPEVRSEPARSRLTVPIMLKGNRCGALSLVTRTPRAYGGREQALAEELAARVALAIESDEAHRRAREELAERERLVFVAAHELRSPLSSLRLAVQTLQRKQPTGDRLIKLLEVIDRDERRLTRMIGDLLDLARIRSGQLDLELDAVDLADVVHEVIGRMAGDIGRSRSVVSIKTSGNAVGRWDRSRLDQVVTNLLSNAIKYGGGRPIEIRVEVGFGADGRQARLVVTDHGQGIAPEVLPRIFEPFARAPGLRNAGGLGLGLYIVDTVVRRLGGDVQVQSVPERGSTFTVALPLAGS
jgi:signal transduction histidine kinase